ncbi:unnamed protein product [Tilletia laevis]|nr:unnamed protein product [Tilletia caries]CAD6920568.1 unnamed protein product [Tilletia caries]CAD6961733.1 unnamed protein product [Tilletia laevis]
MLRSYAANSAAAGGGSSAGGSPNPVLRDRLAARSRVTNLGVVLLIAFLALSVLVNLRTMFVLHKSRSSFRGIPPPGFGSWESFHGLSPESLRITAADPINGTQDVNHLVLVVGHAVWAGCEFSGKDSDANWILEQYQRGGSAKTYWKHIQRGLEIANEDPTALLVFSGGQTRPQSLQTEAESYFSLAVSSGEKLPTLPHVDQAKAISHDSIGAENESTGDQAVVGTGAHANAAVATHNAPLGLQGLRMTTENYALDSFQNLLFSFARFREYTGHYPERITVVGYNVKRARFEELHAKAIRWSTKAMWSSKKRWTYVGIDDEGISAAAAKLQGDGEYLRGYSWFSKDMYGCHGNLLEKRKKRNPTRRFHPYFTSTPEIADLLDWCPAPDSGLQGIYRGSLPWDPRVSGPDGGWGRGAVQYKEELKQNGWRPLGGGPDSKKEWFSWVQVGPERPYK